MQSYQLKTAFRLTLLALLAVNICSGQTSGEGNFVPDLNIKTPETSALLKSLETPVSYNTGIPNISIPIYNINEGDIAYPISVSYNSSGVNVSERAGWVGMGFSLSQPQVTRIVKGIPDDSPNHGFIYETEYTTENGGIRTHFESLIENSRGGTIDLESDEYRAVLPNGESLCFYFSQNRSVYPKGEIIQFPMTNNRITPVFEANRLKGWEITGTDGFVYTFGIGVMMSPTYTYTVTESDLPTLDGKSFDGDFQSSWMITKIKSPSNRQLNFSYAQYNYEDCNLANQRRDVYSPVYVEIFNNVGTTYQKTKGTAHFMESISGDFGKVIFTLDQNTREDYAFGKKLNAITILDRNQNLVNSYQFGYTYKISDSPVAPIYSCGYLNTTSDLTKRLFLDRITILGNTSSAANKPFYSFSYNELALPHRFSYARDWWGYYNGATANHTIVPTFRRFDDLMPNRNVHSAYSQAGLLAKVTYPTGGHTQYEFENNRGLNEKTIVELYQTTSQNIPPVDGISIIPSVKAGLAFDSLNSTPLSNVSYQGGRKVVYEIPFLLGDNVVGYNYSMITGSSQYTVNMPVRITANCTACNYGQESLPIANGCSIYYKIIKDGTQYTNSLISGSQNGYMNLPVGTVVNSINIQPQNYKLVVEIYTGRKTVFDEPIFNLASDNVHLELGWEVYDSSMVAKIGNKYDIPLGGHRIKSIKTYADDNAIPIEKRYSYKDDAGIESGFCRLNLTNYFVYGNIYYLNSDNYYPMQQYQGQPVGYSSVKEINVAPGETKTTSFKYLFFSHAAAGDTRCYLYGDSHAWDLGIFPCGEDPMNGLLVENKIGNEKTIVTHYSAPNPELNLKYIKGYSNSNRLPAFSHTPEPVYAFSEYRISTFHTLEPLQTIATENFNGNEIVSTTDYAYDTTSHLQLRSKETTASDGLQQMEKYYYAGDLLGEPFMADLKAANRISIPIKTESYSNGNKLSETKTVFTADASTTNLLKEKMIYAAKFPNALPLLANVGNLEKKISFDKYDTKGNLLQYTQENGQPVSVIWGYGQQKPIAKIENAAYASINTGLIATAVNASNLAPASGQQQLLSALEAIRVSLPDASVTSYTYKPEIGISAIIDPKGDRITYEYDSFGRLTSVKNKDGKPLASSEYHYLTETAP